ncbi:MAG: hypothetical protein V7K48_01930 [Nostoc sp.]|uniref:hypothetical protein n=1 Tax=Nostoc sp. TaxID=1180 RepID=UPI002FF5AA75
MMLFVLTTTSFTTTISLIEEELCSTDATDFLCTSCLSTTVAAALIVPQSQTQLIMHIVLHHGSHDVGAKVEGLLWRSHSCASGRNQLLLSCS